MRSVDTPAFNVLSLCAGLGGLDLGLRLAVPGARSVCFVEREAYCCEVLAARMHDGSLDAAPVWSNLRTFDGRPWRGVVDCVTGGYPCQPFSIAGKRMGDRDERHLWPDVARIVREVEPGWCFFENVGNHLRLGFEQVHDDLRGMGYRVAAGLFTAAEVGASHKRERLFIAAKAVDDSAVSRHESSGGWESPESQGGERLLGVGRDELVQCLYPPLPGDFALWERILAQHPGLAPATEPDVHGVADGLAYRLDRLRACGNGVVPAVAALAWRTLTASLTGLVFNTEATLEAGV